MTLPPEKSQLGLYCVIPSLSLTLMLRVWGLRNLRVLSTVAITCSPYLLEMIITLAESWATVL